MTPPLDGSGGIGRLMQAVIEELRDTQVRLTLLDPRSRATHPIFSVGPLVASALRLTLLGLTRRVDVAHINIASRGSTFRKIVMVYAARAAGTPVVLHLHGGNYRAFYSGMPAFVQRLIANAFRRASTVIVLGETWREFVVNALGVDAASVIVLPNAVAGPAGVSQSPRHPGKPLNILFLGRLSREKGLDDLFQALATAELRDADWRLRVAGDGEAAIYRDLARGLGIGQKIDLLGWVDRERAGNLITASHIVALPSYVEGLPMVLLEACAAGVPAVTTDVGAISEVITSGIEGVILAPGDMAAIARAISDLYRDEPLRLRLGTAARKRWKSAHALNDYVERLVHIWFAQRVAPRQSATSPVVWR